MKKSELMPMPAAAEVVEVIERPSSAAPQPPQNPLVVIHSLLRGSYKLAITLAILGATLGAVGGYFAQPPTYRSTGLIRVKPVLPKVMYDLDEKGLMPRFDSFVDSQVEFIKSQRVLDLAMQDPTWKAFGRGLSDESIRDFKEGLEVARPKNSELIVVAFIDRDPSAASTAVNAVMSAYLKLYGNKDSETDAPRMAALERYRTELDAQIRLKNNAIRTIAQEFGSDGDALRRRYDFKLDELNKLESQLLLAQLAVAMGDARQAVQQQDDPQARTAVDHLRLLQDPEWSRLRREKNGIDRQIAILSARFGPEHPEMMRARSTQSGLEQDLSDREALVKLIGSATGRTSGVNLADTTQTPQELRAAEQRIKALYDRVQSETIELGRKNLDITNLREELLVLRDRLKATEAQIDAEQLERKNVSGRIEVASEGDRPVGPYKDRRKALAGVGAIGLAGLGVGVLLLVRLSDRRMHWIADAQSQLRAGPRVLGIVPELESDALEFNSATVAAYCVHQIRALLQMRRDAQGHPTFAITSPSAGDGKTTLSVALGMSFAASGTKTLLVDLDLVGRGLTHRINRASHRRLGRMLVREGLITEQQLTDAMELRRRNGARLGEVLVRTGALTREQLENALLAQLKSVAGLSDVLAGESLSDCVVSSGMPNLYILPLGSAGREQAGQLSPASVNRIIHQAQSDFAAVLIDTGPILGSLEASMVAGTSAGVVLTVSRGSSKTLARRAAEYLLNAGAQVEGIVFNRAKSQDLISSGYASYAGRVSRVGKLTRSQSRP